MPSTRRAFVRATIALCALPAACAKNGGNAEGVSVAASGSGNPLTLAMVTDVGGLGDKSFNDSAYAGLIRAKNVLGAQIQVLQSKTASDYQPNLTVLADEDEDMIYAIGFLMDQDLAEVAKNYPKRHFAIIDAVVDQPNVASVTFREQEGSFLAGALAALVSRSHKVGFLGGEDLPLLRKFEAGFIAGARQIDPRIDVAVKYVGSFDDVASGKELAGVVYDGGADVLYVAAGKSGLGAIDEARGRTGAYAIGVDGDQDALAPGKILTSVVKHVDVAVFRIALDTRSQKIPARHLELGLRDGGITLTDFKYTSALVGEKNLRTLDALRAAIVAGTIVPPATRAALAAFEPATAAQLAPHPPGA